MPLDALIALARRGYDAQYVCTGQRSVNRKTPSALRGTRDTPAAYSVDEVDWIVRLRRLTPAEREQAKAMLDVLVPKKKRQRRTRP